MSIEQPGKVLPMPEPLLVKLCKKAMPQKEDELGYRFELSQKI